LRENIHEISLTKRPKSDKLPAIEYKSKAMTERAGSSSKHREPGQLKTGGWGALHSPSLPSRIGERDERQ
jgi:hypothetical protein